MVKKRIFSSAALGALLGALLGWLGNTFNIEVSGQFGLLIGLMLGGLVSLLVIELRQGNDLKQALSRVFVIYGLSVIGTSIAISQGVTMGILVGVFVGSALGALSIFFPEWFSSQDIS